MSITFSMIWVNKSSRKLNVFLTSISVIFTPFCEHIKDGWNHRNDKNVLFLFYEDLVNDLGNQLRKMAEFLEVPLSEDDLPKLIQHLNFKSFQENPSLNLQEKAIFKEKHQFIRRGQVGGNPEMTEEISTKIDEWMNEKLGDCDLKFPL